MLGKVKFFNSSRLRFIVDDETGEDVFVRHFTKWFKNNEGDKVEYVIEEGKE